LDLQNQHRRRDRASRREFDRNVLEEQRRDELLETLRSVGHSKIASSTLSRLTMTVRHIPHDALPSPELLAHLEELVVGFRDQKGTESVFRKPSRTGKIITKKCWGF